MFTTFYFTYSEIFGEITLTLKTETMLTGFNFNSWHLHWHVYLSILYRKQWNTFSYVSTEEQRKDALQAAPYGDVVVTTSKALCKGITWL